MQKTEMALVTYVRTKKRTMVITTARSSKMIQETINIMVMIICRILIAAPTLKITVKQRTVSTSDKSLWMEITIN